MRKHTTTQAAQVAEHARSIVDMLAARPCDPAQQVIADALLPLLFPETVEQADPGGYPTPCDQSEGGPWSFHGEEVNAY